MYHPIKQDEFVFASLITICLVAINPVLALFAVLVYMIIRSRVF